MIEVTTGMLFAAIKQAAKEGIIKASEVMPIEEYERQTAAWERVLQAAVDASDNNYQGCQK